MLPSLEIKNFRMLEDFRVEKLGRVNLIVGRNNSGKSSVLEALRIYAGNANHELLAKIAAEHDERDRVSEREELGSRLPFEAFFSGREFPGAGRSLSIGPVGGGAGTMSIEYGMLVESDEATSAGGKLITSSFFPGSPGFALKESDSEACLRVARNDKLVVYVRLEQSRRRGPLELWCPVSMIPTRFVSIDELADAWDSVALTDAQNVVRDALRIVTSEFEDITFVRNDGASEFRRTARVKLSTSKRPVPLGSLGDGMVRVLQLALKLFAAKGGFFLIDEFENGLHYSVQEKVWTLLFTMAERLDIQIFATTHSWDCIESFSKVAKASDAKGVLFRVGRSVRTSDHGKVIATVFDEEQLFNITQGDVEVR